MTLELSNFGGPDPCCFNRLFSNLVRRVRRRIRHGRRVNGPRDGAGEDVSFAWFYSSRMATARVNPALAPLIL